jgi:hypothetical protein
MLSFHSFGVVKCVTPLLRSSKVNFIGVVVSDLGQNVLVC